MRVVLFLFAGCSFVPGVLPAEAPIDAMIDAAPPFCPSDPRLRLCFSFDQAAFGASLPNEGAAQVSAQLTNVTRTAHEAGGAAQLDASSTIFLPMTTEVTNIQAIEVWYRADTEPAADGARMGLVDSNIGPPNISLFLYRADPGHTLRCGIGEETIVWPATLITSAWTHLACVCEAGNLKMYVNGTMVGDTPGPCSGGGAFLGDGFTIGSNNNGGPTGVNDWLLGAIDGVRLWDVPITPPQPTML